MLTYWSLYIHSSRHSRNSTIIIIIIIIIISSLILFIISNDRWIFSSYNWEVRNSMMVVMMMMMMIIIIVIIIIIIINPVTLSCIYDILESEIRICDIILTLVRCLWKILYSYLWRAVSWISPLFAALLPSEEGARVVSKKYQCGMFGGQSVNTTTFSLITLVPPYQNHCIIPATWPFIFCHQVCII